MTLSDRELDRRLATLARTIEPPQAPWTDIERRLVRQRRNWPGRIVAMAAIAASLAIAVLIVDSPDPSVTNPAATVHIAEAAAMRSQAAGYYLPASLDINGGLVEAWEDNQAAIEELEAALARNPGNTLLIDFLAQARLRQSQLINQATVGGTVVDQRSI